MNKIYTKLLLGVLFVLCTIGANAQQGLATYTPNRTTGNTYNSISATGTSFNFWRAATVSTDDNLSSAVDIGFNFLYDGVQNCQVQISTNGFLTLLTNSGATGATSGQAYNWLNNDLFTTANGSVRVVAPFYDDLQTAANSGTLANLQASMKYQTTGSAPNRVFTAEWINMQDFATASTSNFNFQIKLFEGTNDIEFNYGTMTYSGTTTVMSYSCGLNSITLSGASPFATTMLFTQQTANTATFGGTQQNLLGGTTAADMPLTASSIHFTYGGAAPVPMSGAYSVPASFPTMTALINALNYNGTAGATVVNIPAGSTFTEDLPALQTGCYSDAITWQKSGAGANPVIRPTGTAVGTIDYGFRMFGVDNFTWDGLDIAVNSATVEFGLFLSQLSDRNGCQNNTFRNFNITMNRANTVSSVAILMNSAAQAALTAGGPNAGNVFKNFSIKNSHAGIQFNAATVASYNAVAQAALVLDNNNQITSDVLTNYNIIGDPATPNDFQPLAANTGYAVFCLGQKDLTISNCSISNITTTGTGSNNAIIVNGTSTAQMPANTFSQGTLKVFNNKIFTSRATSATAGVVAGIRANVNGNAGTGMRIYNNFIGDLSSASTVTATRRIVGIQLQDAGTGNPSTIEVSHNSVSMSPAGILCSNSGIEAYTSTSGPVFTLKNNIVANLTAAQAAAAKHYCLVSTSATVFGNTGTISDYNDLYVANATNGYVGLGLTTDYATLANWQTAVSKDANSVSIVPVFTSATDLHLVGAVNTALNNLGTPVAGITQDIDNQARDLVNPDMGADEFGIPYTWTGATNTNWSLAGNWLPMAVPGSLDNATIPVVANLPALTASVPVNDLNIGIGATVDINGQTFTINGAVTGSGTLSGSPTSNLALNGTAGTLYFTGALNALNNLSLAATTAATLGSSLNLYGVLGFTAGSSLNMNAQAVTLKSTATATARVGNLTGSTLSGASNVTVERYINSDVVGRKWHLLSGISTTSAQAIRQSWQENGGAVNNLGTWITSGTSSLPGYDATSTGTSSVLSHNPVTPAWVTPAATNTGSINDNQGYMLFVRGDRNALPSNALTAPTVMRTTGTLKQGLQAGVTILNSNPAYTLIGNPYASPIVFDTLITNTTNLSSFFYVWDASYAGSYGVGGFRLVQRTGAGTYTATPATGSDNTLGYIHSGQAFLVKTTGAGDASVVFNENSKATSLSVVNPIIATGIDQQIYTSLVVMGDGNKENLADAVRVRFNDGYSAATTDDAPKMSNFNENISSYRNNKKFIVELRPMITTKDTIFLFMSNMTVNNYRFKVSSIDFTQSNVNAWLQDAYTGTNTPLDLTGNNLDIDFKVNSDAASANNNRFRIVFEAKAIQPQTSITLKATQATNAGGRGTTIAVEWKAADQNNMKQYELESSTDGVHYNKVNTQTAMGANGSTFTYNWTDMNPQVGDNYYRVSSISMSGEVKVSNPVVVTITGTNPAITVYPNPVTNHTVSLQFADMQKGVYQVRMFTLSGQLVFTKTISHAGGNAVQTLLFDRSIAKGSYRLEIINPDNSKTSKAIIITQ